MTSFIKNQHKSLVFGGLTFLLPLSLGGFCAYYLLDFEWMGALLLASIFSTHTLISYPIVQRFRIAQNEAVADVLSIILEEKDVRGKMNQSCQITEPVR